MLLKALVYFFHNLLRSPGEPGFRFVSGETHWDYRLWVEGFFFALAFAALAVWGLSTPSTPNSGFTYLLLFPSLGLLGVVEMMRLIRLRREQIEFAELFYD